jgi:SpoIIAA-like
MLAYHLNPDTGIVELRPRGPLEAHDFTSLGLTVDSYLEDHGKLRGVLVEVDRFPRWDDWQAISAHVRFVREHLPKVDRVAVVTDNPWLEPLPEVMRLLTPFELRSFSTQQRGEAFAWIYNAQAH